MSENWLEVMWGWLPLLEDFYSAYNTLLTLGNEAPQVHYVARLKKKGPFPVPGTPYALAAQDKSFYVKKLHAFFPQPVPPWTSLGIDAPEQVRWEMLPYSWAIDYMLPFGDWLSTVGLFSRVIGGEYWETSVSRMDLLGVVQTDAFPGKMDLSEAMDSREQRLIYTRKAVHPTTSIPFPRCKPANEILSWRRATNVVAVTILNKTRIARNVNQYYR